MATPEEQAIQGVIDQIWDTYDADKSGALDKEETKKFVQDTLGNLGSGDEFSQEAFDEVFSTFDKDNSGTVEKNEMVVFIKQLLGGQWAPRICVPWDADKKLLRGVNWNGSSEVRMSVSIPKTCSADLSRQPKDNNATPQINIKF